MLSQSEATVHGDPTLKMENSREQIRLPILVAVIDPKGKTQIEGTAQLGFGTVIFNFDGVAKGETMSGRATNTAQVNLFGKEDAGTLEFRRVR